VAETVK